MNGRVREELAEEGFGLVGEEVIVAGEAGEDSGGGGGSSSLSMHRNEKRHRGHLQSHRESTHVYVMYFCHVFMCTSFRHSSRIALLQDA